MRVRIYKRIDGESMVLIVPARRLHLPPVVLQGITRENRAERLLPAIVAAARPVPAQLALPGS